MRRLLLALLCWGILPCTASADSVGPVPDDHAYGVEDIAYDFEDISGTGTAILAGTDDAGTGALALGFTFSFYAVDYTTLQSSANGYVVFEAAQSGFANIDLTDLDSHPGVGVGGQNIAACAWDDWSFSTIGGSCPTIDKAYYQTLGSAPNRRFIFQWNEAKGFISSPSCVTFQTKVFETSNIIECHYKDMDAGNFRSNGGSATVGLHSKGNQTSSPANCDHRNCTVVASPYTLSGYCYDENRSATEFPCTLFTDSGSTIQWSFNQGVLADLSAIRFTPNFVVSEDEGWGWTHRP